MLALFLTFVIAAYLLGPDLVSRWVLGFVCPRKNIIQSRGEELTRAVAWAVIPLGVAWFWAARYGPLAECASWADWKLFLLGAYSSTFFEQHSNAIFHALDAVFWWNFALLWRTYAIVLAFWILVDLIIYNFGAIRQALNRKHWRWVIRILTLFIVPRVSEWHVLLSNMLVERKDIRIRADILTKGDVLYRGFVADKTVGSRGELSSIILADPVRFRRQEYMEVKLLALKSNANRSMNPDHYWAKIPSKTFIIMGPQIISINLLYSSPSAVTEDKSVRNALRNVLEGDKNKVTSGSIED